MYLNFQFSSMLLEPGVLSLSNWLDLGGIRIWNYMVWPMVKFLDTKIYGSPEASSSIPPIFLLSIILVDKNDNLERMVEDWQDQAVCRRYARTGAWEPI